MITCVAVSCSSHYSSNLVFADLSRTIAISVELEWTADSDFVTVTAGCIEYPDIITVSIGF